MNRLPQAYGESSGGCVLPVVLWEGRGIEDHTQNLGLLVGGHEVAEGLRAGIGESHVTLVNTCNQLCMYRTAGIAFQ